VKKKIVVLLSLLMLTGLGIIFTGSYMGANAQESVDVPKERLISQIIHTGLERWHYSGMKIDDNFSMKAFSEFLELLDSSKRFLL